MGKVDLAVKKILRRKDVFADLMNGTIYGGRQVLTAADLEMYSGESEIFYRNEKEKSNALERRGDVRMRADFGMYSVILATEHQNKVHYAMAVRAMLYDALEYTKQVQDLEKKHKEKGEKLEDGEFLSGITKEDRLMPVVTVILYTGPDWDGAKSLHEMIGVRDDWNSTLLKRYLPEYRLNLFDVNAIEDMKVFRSCLQYIFSMVKLKKDKRGLYEYLKEHKKELNQFDSAERMAALVLLGESRRLSKILNEKESEEWDVCEAIDELIKDGEKRGERRGEQRGEIKGENRMARLVQMLMEARRYDDVKRASQDKDYRVQLYGEYNI